MSTLLIQAAGAGVGYLIGGPTGAQYGWAAGGILAQAFAPKDEIPPSFGPRLGDLKVQAATYGVGIPRVFGVCRIAGNIIWTTDIIETATTESVESGGKGGGGASQSQTTYSYSQSFAVGLCEGQVMGQDGIIGIRRIWANGKLIYNLGDDADTDTAIMSQQLPITIHLGTESQTPSSLMESYLGAGNVPAYRGLAYVEFTDLPLGPYGNRTPNLEFEVIQSGTAASGIDWELEQQITPSPLVSNIIDSAYGGGICVIPTEVHTFVSTDNGETWTNVAGRNGNQPNAAIVWATDRFVTTESTFPGNTNCCRISLDGVTWTAGGTFIGGATFQGETWRVDYDEEEDELLSVNHYKNAYLVGITAVARRSLDRGTTWSEVTSIPLDWGFSDVAYGDGAWVIISDQFIEGSGGTTIGQVMNNLDDPALLSWVERTAATAVAWWRVEFVGSGTFIAIAQTGEAMRSGDRGNTWELLTLPSVKSLFSISSDKEGTVCIVTRDGSVSDDAFISFDYGDTWQTTTFPLQVRMDTVVYGDGTFIGSGRNSAGWPSTTVDFLTLDPPRIAAGQADLGAIVSDLSQLSDLTTADIEVTALTGTLVDDDLYEKEPPAMTDWREALTSERGAPMVITMRWGDRAERGELRFANDDGGRRAAGYTGTAPDCLCRGIAIVGGIPYQEVHEHFRANGCDPERGDLSLGVGISLLRNLGARWIERSALPHELPKRGRLLVIADTEGPDSVDFEMGGGSVTVRNSDSRENPPHHCYALIDGVIRDGSPLCLMSRVIGFFEIPVPG